MDSKLVVEQMSGRWKVKHPDLIELHAAGPEAGVAVRPGPYAWVPRAKNSHADRLANEAMDAAAGIEDPARESEPAVAEPTKSVAAAGQDVAGLDRRARHADPAAVAAARADGTVG